MNPIPAAFLVGVMVTLSRWSQGKGIAIDNVLGVAGVAVTLGVLAAINEQLARSFGALTVVGVALWQAPKITTAAGFTSKGIKPPNTKPYGRQEFS